MKKEVSKTTKTMLPEVMKKFNAFFSIELSSGFAHIKIEEGGEMYVEWLNEDGYMKEEDNHTPFKDIERVANFMREMKELRLSDYSK